MAASPQHSGNGALPSQNGQGALYDAALPGMGAQTTSLREWLGLLWSGKWIILAAGLLAVIGTGLYIHSLPSSYRTSTLLYIDKDNGGIASQLGGQQRSSFFREDNTLKNELFLLQYSNVIADRVARRLKALGRHPRTGEALPMLVGPGGDSLSVGAVAGRVSGSTSAYSAGGESVNAMRIGVTSSSPAQATLIANLYADEYIARTKERSRESMQASRKFLEKQERKLKRDLQSIEAKIQNYMQEHEAVALDQASSKVIQRISDLEARRSELQIDLDMKRAVLENLKAEVSNAEPKLAEQLSSSLNEQLKRVQTEKAELQNRIDLIERRNSGINGGGTRARELRRMRKRVDQLTRKADSLAQAYVDQALATGGTGGSEGSGVVGNVAQKRQRATKLRIEMNGLEAQLGVVEDRLAEQRSRLESIPEQSIELAQLQRERRSTEQVFGFVREKLQETRLSEQSELGFAEVVQPASISRVPIGPGMTPNLVLALFLGLGAGAVCVVVWAKLDTHVRQPDDLKQKGYTVTGVVPPMDDLIAEELGGDDRVAVGDGTIASELVMLTSPMSAAAEAYRHVRANLQFAQPDRAMQTMVVTSAEQGEGKTTTAANLALAFASANKDTLLIDADFRHPRLHRLFGVSKEPGLTQVLYERTGGETPYHTEIDHLSLLPAGEEVPNPAELLGSQRMRRFLDEKKQEYDIVILDTPPTLLFSDGLALSAHCDGTLLLAAAASSDGRSVDHAAEQIREMEGTLLGCVLNRYEGSSTIYGYGSNYGYAQGYKQLSSYYDDGREKASATGFRAWWGR